MNQMMTQPKACLYQASRGAVAVLFATMAINASTSKTKITHATTQRSQSLNSNKTADQPLEGDFGGAGPEAKRCAK